MTLDDAKFLGMAYEEAKAGYDEGGIPVSTSILPLLHVLGLAQMLDTLRRIRSEC